MSLSNVRYRVNRLPPTSGPAPVSGDRCRSSEHVEHEEKTADGGEAGPQGRGPGGADLRGGISSELKLARHGPEAGAINGGAFT